MDVPVYADDMTGMQVIDLVEIEADKPAPASDTPAFRFFFQKVLAMGNDPTLIPLDDDVDGIQIFTRKRPAPDKRIDFDIYLDLKALREPPKHHRSCFLFFRCIRKGISKLYKAIMARGQAAPPAPSD